MQNTPLKSRIENSPRKKKHHMIVFPLGDTVTSSIFQLFILKGVNLELPVDPIRQKTRWWFQIFCFVHPGFGEDSNFD